jgi:pSer/pThr/pTyr-binding forkhead associated (FHA) protein
VKLLRSRNSPRPNPLAPATLIVAAARQEMRLEVDPGRSLIVGRDPAADIVLADTAVSARHVLIKRQGPGWLVSSLDDSNLACLLDATGRARPIESELGLRSGELLVGECRLRLYSPPS